jgi:hypothetical protein
MNNTPIIERLTVTHRLKSPDGITPVTNTNALRLDTCLREVVIEWLPKERSCPPVFGDAERIRGVDAYRLLLEIATGLRSAVPGETNVFGQFRHAWHTFLEDGHPNHTTDLMPVMRRLFDDTKTVRQHWLEGIGGASYGSLVRRLIEPDKRDRVLFVGAGELTRSMLPLFGKYRLAVWNHRPHPSLSTNVDTIFAPGYGRQAADWADHVILTTPRDPHNDRAWQAWLKQARPRTVVHLGHRRTDWNLGIDWDPGIAAYSLNDVFLLRRDRDDYRSKRLDRAQAACASLANLLHNTTRAGSVAA